MILENAQQLIAQACDYGIDEYGNYTCANCKEYIQKENGTFHPVNGWNCCQWCNKKSTCNHVKVCILIANNLLIHLYLPY